MVKNLILVFIGGGLGSVARFLISKINYSNLNFPVGTLFVNLLGSFLIGVLIGYGLKNNNLNIKKVKEKFTIQLIWNDLIYQKFNKKIIINKDRIREEILENPERKQLKELLLSEIIFNASNKNEYLEKYEKILSDISKSLSL